MIVVSSCAEPDGDGDAMYKALESDPVSVPSEARRWNEGYTLDDTG